jgi:SAM-dependent methyltransferase
MAQNCDAATVDGFGRQWQLFDQSTLPETELRDIWQVYFNDFPQSVLTPKSVGMDIGCGTGRWAQFVAPLVRELICVDASAGALAVAQTKLGGFPNCRFHMASIENIPVPDNSLDFAYCLGVLHYLPDPEAGLRCTVAKLKASAPILIYVYYAMDARPWWFRTVWRTVDLLRRTIAPAPFRVRYLLSQLIAAIVYYPMARIALLGERLGASVTGVPLSQYRHRSFYTMRTDALDRFGNRIEHRFTGQQLQALMERAGLCDISFSPGPPWWLAVGYKRAD